MAIQQSALYTAAVSVWIPNEVEGQILGGTQTHADATADACFALRTHAARRGFGWVVRQETELRYRRAVPTRPRDRIGTLYPDCLVAIGVRLPYDAPYDLTQLSTAPDLVIEIISPKTRRKDIGPKVHAYAQLGIREYVTFDPIFGCPENRKIKDLPTPRKQLELHGYRLVGPRQYGPIAVEPEGGLWLASVELRIVGEWGAAGQGRLLFFTQDGERLLRADEEAAARLEAERAQQRAETRAKQAEAQAARLRALLDQHGIRADNDA